MASLNFLLDECSSRSRRKCDASVQTNEEDEEEEEEEVASNKRSSFQDVEEALNSLLWQPYEYQTNSLTSLHDLDDPLNKESFLLLHQLSQEEEANGGGEGEEENTDLNLCCTEMVNNLKPPSSGQCRNPFTSRDAFSRNTTTTTTASRLKSQAVATTISLLELFAGDVSHTVRTGVGRDSGCCDVFLDNFGDMQIELAAGCCTGNNNNNVLNIVTGDGVNNNNGNGSTTRYHHANNNNANLSSVNVVGLPSFDHDWTTNNNRTTVPYNKLVPVHQKSTSQIIDQRQQQSITHSRSASVPKSMQIGPNQTQDLNVSNVNVNFYRAVPVNVVSSVPTIQCLNTVDNDNGNNISNVQIMPLGNDNSSLGSGQVPAGGTTTTQVTVHASPGGTTSRRTFTSTEAQTDDLLENSLQNVEVVASGREQRRRDRRERKHQRRLNNTSHRHHITNDHTTVVDSGTQSDNVNFQTNAALPDLLNSHHLPPPYTPPSGPPQLPQVMVPHPVMLHHHPHHHHHHHQQVPPLPPPNVVPSALVTFPPPPTIVTGGQVPLVQGTGPVAVPVVSASPPGLRFPFPVNGFRRGRFSEDPPKGCCGLLTWKPGSLRWFIAVIALVAVCCVLVGTALGAMRPSGRDHLTVSLLMIGVGIVLVTVSGIAWRLTSHDSSTCRSMWGLGSTESVDVCTRRFVPRLPPSYGRPHHPYAAMMYPEFQYRPPPPSYQASMQEYRLRLLLLDRGNGPQMRDGIQNAVSPPPTYRSHAGSLLRGPLSSNRAYSEYSCPPSYHSQSLGSAGRRGGRNTSSSVLHSREQSLSLSDSNHPGDNDVVNVVSILGSTEEDIALDDLTLDSLKIEPKSDIKSNNNPLRMLLKSNSVSDLDKDGNLVTIVQTNDQNPVIVTVSGSSQFDNYNGNSNNNRNCNNNNVQISSSTTCGATTSPEMEVLAHL